MLAGRSSLLRQNRILANHRHPLSKTCNSSRNDVVTTMTRNPNTVVLFHSGRMVYRKPTKSSSISSKKRAKQELSVQQQQQQQQQQVPPKEEAEFDPHAMASEMIQNSSTRIQGTEAIASMTPEQKMKNYATATSLVGFVTFVWWYSMQSVGRNTSSTDSDDDDDDDGIESRLREEAKDATNRANAKRISDEEVQELTQLDVTLDDAENDDLIVAVAAPHDIATLEEDRNLGTSKATTHRPLWKKIVFFWKRDS